MSQTGRGREPQGCNCVSGLKYLWQGRGGKFIVNKTFDVSLIYFHFNVLTKSKDLTIGLQQCVTELRVVLLPL